MNDLTTKAIILLQDGAKKVEFDWDGLEVTAYWVKDLLRIDIKGVKKNNG